MTNRKFLSLLLALFMVLGTVTPMFAENDSITVLPPRMAKKEEPDNIVIMKGDKDTIPTLEESGEGGKKIEETLEEPEIKEDNSPVILENREENNNIVILPPIKNEENEEGITEPSKETVEPEEPKKEKESKREVKVQILSKRDVKKPASEGEVNLVLLNDNPADINEEVYDEKIRWKESDFKIEDDKIISLSDEGLLKVARNKKLEIPEMENITIIEKEAFKGLSLRSVEIPKNIKEIKDEAFKDNHLKSVKILGKGKEISKNAFNEELVEMYGKCEKEEFLNEYEEDELEVGEEIVGDAVGAVAPDDVSLYTFSGTKITGLSEKGKTYYATNHNMVLPGKNPYGQAITAIGEKAFYDYYNGYGLTSVDFKNLTSLTSIGNEAFRRNKLTSLDLSRCTNLTSIGYQAFFSNQLTSLDLSGCTNLTSIEGDAFNYNKLTNLNLSGCTNLTSIGGSAFDDNGLTSLDLSGCVSLKSIGGQAFNHNKLTGIDLSGCTSLTSIDYWAFNQNQLTSLDLSGCVNLTNIGSVAFGHNQLKTSKIPLSLKTLADNAFGYNPGNNDKNQVYLYTTDKTNPNNLKDTKYHLINPISGPDDVSLYTFSGTTITGLSEKGKTYYENNHNMVLPGKNPQGQAITAIGKGAFQHNRLSSLDFSRCTSLTTIGSDAFCSNFLLALDLSGCTSLTNIGHYAFRDNKLKTAKIPLSLSILSEFAFKDNHGNNYNKQVYLFTPDYTNPNNLRGSSYHLINPAEGIYDVSLYTFSGTTITGLSEKGKTYYATNHNMILPGKNPRGQAVTAIESEAFYNGRKGYGLTSVDFSYCTSLTSIGRNAFNFSRLTSLDLSKCTKLKNIGDYAFNKNNLTNLDLSRCTRLASIGEGAFCENQLTSLDLSRCTSLTNIGPGAFYQNKLTSLDLSRCTSLTSIGPTAFCRNQLTSLDLSGCTSLTSIGISAFTGSKLKTAKIPLSLATLSDDAFKENLGNNDKKQVYLYTPDYTNPNNLKDTDYHLINPVESSDDVTLYTFDGTTITGLSERGKKYYETHHDMKLPGKNPQGQDVTAIGEAAFYNKGKGYGLTSADFSNCTNLTSIGYGAFKNNKLASLNLSGCISLTSIGGDAFAGNQLSALDLSGCKNLKNIGDVAFEENQIASLDLSKCTNITSIGAYAFDGNRLKILDLSKCTSLTSIGNFAFDSNQLKTVKIPLSLKTLTDDAFKGNPGSNDKKQVYLYTPDYTNPNNLKDTSYHLINPVESSDDVTLYTFNGTTITGLSERGKKYFAEHHEMILPGKNPQGQDITAIGEEAFSNNDNGYGITSVSFSNCKSLERIDGYAFNFNKITSLNLSECTNLTSIGEAAFQENQLTSLNLSECTSLTSIGGYAFGYNQLTKLDLSKCANLKSIGIYAFQNNQLTNLNLSGCINLLNIGNNAFQENRLTSLNLSGCTRLASIGDFAFNKNQLTSLDLTKCTNLINIGNYAFNRNQLKTAKIPLSLKNIGDNALKNNPGNNDKKQVYLYTPDYTNPNNLQDSTYHLINPITGPDDVSLYTFNGTTITGLSERGKKYFAEHHDMILPGKNPQGQTITEIGAGAFDNNGNGYGLTSVDFKNLPHLISIVGAAFKGNQLTSLDLSGCKSLKFIGDEAFYKNQLTSLDLSGCTNLERIGTGVFSYNRLTNLDLSGCKSLTSIYPSAFSNNKLTNLNLSGCTNLTNIGGSAFSKNQLTSLDLSECTSLERISMGAFSNNKLTNLNLSGCTNLTNIGRGAFAMNQFASLDLSEYTSLTSIESFAFAGNQLKTAKIPLSLKTLADDAFKGNPGNNDKKQVYLYTPDKTNPNNLKDTDYHLINPETKPDDFNLYTFDGTTITGLTEEGKKYYKTHHDMVLPGKTPSGKDVTSLGKSAFYNLGLTSVVFSKLTALTTLGQGAFSSNNIAKLDLSKNTNLQVIENDVFYKNQISSLNLAGLTKLTSIGDWAFGRNKLTSLDLSPLTSLTTIGGDSFRENQISTLNMSGLKSLELIKRGAFYANKLTNLDLTECTNLKSINEVAFNNNLLTDVNMSGLKNLQNIDSIAFGSNQISNLNMENMTGLKTIGESAFDSNKLSTLDLSTLTALETINNYAFYQNNLKTVKIPLSLKNLSDNAFKKNPGSNDRKQVYLYTPDYTNPNNLKDTDFHLINPITGSDDVSLYTFNGTTITGLSERGKKYFETHHEMKFPGRNPQGEAITAIGDNAFYNNSKGYGLTSVDFSNCISLESIGNSAFYKNKLTSLDLSGCTNLTSIGNNAFIFNDLASLDLSGCISLTSIGDYAFRGNRLKSLNLSRCTSLASIGRSAFYNNRLKTAKIPLSLKNLADGAFGYNSGSNAQHQVYLYTPRRNNPMNLKDSVWHLVDPISFTIKKVDAKGKPMEGVEFAFYKLDRPTPPQNWTFPNPSTVVGVKPIFLTVTTDKNGTAEITLPYSPYFLAENKTIPGYSINNTVTQIDATIEGKTITYTDYEVSIEVPKTGTLGIIPYILLAFILVCGAYVVLRKKKEEK